MGRLGRFYVLGKGKCNYEKEVYVSGVNREIHYLYGGNGLAGIYVRTDGKDTLFAAVTDRQNSLTAVMDVATGKVEKFSYKPWGMRRNPANWSENVVTDYPARFSRGYCMHEHFSQLGLINMGGRIFDERTNQFLSPDPYRQAPESWLNCNRFGYCMGNPVMYTDPDGEWVHILVGLIVGGAINLAANWDNCQGFWQHFTAFAVGAGSGALVAATGGAAGASFGMLVGVSSGSCALTMATNNVIAQTGENFAGFGNVDWRSVGVSAAIGFMSGAVGSVAGYGASQFAGKIVCGGFEIASPALRGAIGGAIGGGFSGYASGFIGTLLMTGGDWKQANKSAFNSMYMGAFLGGLSGFAGGLHYAKKNGLSPWTGRPHNQPQYNKHILSDNRIYSTQKGLNEAKINMYLDQMRNGTFDKNSQISVLDYNGAYYISDGHCRMTAAYRYYMETGNDSYIFTLKNNAYIFNRCHPSQYGLKNTHLFK